MFSCKESSGSFVFWRYQWIEVNTTPDQNLIQLDWQLSKITRIHCRFSTSTDVNLIKETNCKFWTLHFIVKKKYSLPQNFSKTTCVGRSDFNSRQASVENDVKLQFPITSGCGFFFCLLSLALCDHAKMTAAGEQSRAVAGCLRFLLTVGLSGEHNEPCDSQQSRPQHISSDRTHRLPEVRLHQHTQPTQPPRQATHSSDRHTHTQVN